MSVAACRRQTGKDGLDGGVFVLLYYMTLPWAYETLQYHITRG
jgi:hypothetical protein